MKPSTQKHAKRRNGHGSSATTPPVSDTRVALYYRVSSEEQAERGTIEAQRNFLHQFTKLYALPVVDEYADDGITGTLPLGERPEGRRLVQDAEAGRFGCVLVYRLTRLGRSLKALIGAHDTLARFGVTIRSATEPFDTSTPIGTFLFQLLSSLAELDKAQVLEQLSRGRDRVASQGKWPGGLVPYGYVVDEQGCLTPSSVFVDVLGITEAELMRDLYTRMAGGSSTVAEATRLNALGVPLSRRYCNGRERTYGTKWHPGPIAEMIARTVYRGTHTLNSRYGAIVREVPPLVDAALWDAANAQIQRNRRLPKSNATRTYLLRGLITCGACGSTYVGQVIKGRTGAGSCYYRCTGRNLTHYPTREHRCRARVVQTTWLEQEVWADCRQFILHPEEALAEAQRQLQARMAQVAGLEQARSPLVQELAKKVQEMDRIMELYRRGRVKLQDAERHLDTIANEEAALRQQLSSLDAQKALAEASEAHLTDARRLLAQSYDKLDVVEQTDDQAVKRQMIERLVHGIRLDTTPDRHVTATITYAFSPDRVVSSSTCRRGWTPRRVLSRRWNPGQRSIRRSNLPM